jgi:hypothetical protein
MIVKIQRALVGEPSLLVYDRPNSDGRGGYTHEIFSQISMPEHAIAAILGEDLKGYFDATLEDGGKSIVFGKRVPDEDW